jgi:hypothetical protein
MTAQPTRATARLPHPVVLAAFSALCGCSGLSSTDAPVELLGGGFVRFEGSRMPTETFLLRIRERVRSADGASELLPCVHVRAGEGATSESIDALLRQLRMAGVRHVVLG